MASLFFSNVGKPQEPVLTSGTMRPLSRPLIVIVGAHAVVLCVAVAMTIRLVWG